MIKSCERCGYVRNTDIDAILCVKCITAKKRQEQDVKWKAKLDEFGFDVVTYVIDKGSHSKITVINRECGHTFSAKINNILSRKSICGVCGPAKRMAHAMEYYVQKYQRDYDLKKYLDYQSVVRKLSEKALKKFPHLINPLNLVRGRVDLDPTAANLDHKVPIIEGFKRGIPPEIIAHPRNLEMIPWRDNFVKKQSMTAEAELLLAELTALRTPLTQLQLAHSELLSRQPYPCYSIYQR